MAKPHLSVQSLHRKLDHAVDNLKESVDNVGSHILKVQQHYANVALRPVSPSASPSSYQMHAQCADAHKRAHNPATCIWCVRSAKWAKTEGEAVHMEFRRQIREANESALESHLRPPHELTDDALAQQSVACLPAKCLSKGDPHHNARTCRSCAGEREEYQRQVRKARANDRQDLSKWRSSHAEWSGRWNGAILASKDSSPRQQPQSPKTRQLRQGGFNGSGSPDAQGNDTVAPVQSKPVWEFDGTGNTYETDWNIPEPEPAHVPKPMPKAANRTRVGSPIAARVDVFGRANPNANVTISDGSDDEYFSVAHYAGYGDADDDDDDDDDGDNVAMTSVPTPYPLVNYSAMLDDIKPKSTNGVGRRDYGDGTNVTAVHHHHHHNWDTTDQTVDRLAHAEKKTAPPVRDMMIVDDKATALNPESTGYPQRQNEALEYGAKINRSSSPQPVVNDIPRSIYSPSDADNTNSTRPLRPKAPQHAKDDQPQRNSSTSPRNNNKNVSRMQRPMSAHPSTARQEGAASIPNRSGGVGRERPASAQPLPQRPATAQPQRRDERHFSTDNTMREFKRLGLSESSLGASAPDPKTTRYGTPTVQSLVELYKLPQLPESICSHSLHADMGTPSPRGSAPAIGWDNGDTCADTDEGSSVSDYPEFHYRPSYSVGDSSARQMTPGGGVLPQRPQSRASRPADMGFETEDESAGEIIAPRPSSAFGKSAKQSGATPDNSDDENDIDIHVTILPKDEGNAANAARSSWSPEPTTSTEKDQSNGVPVKTRVVHHHHHHHHHHHPPVTDADRANQTNDRSTQRKPYPSIKRPASAQPTLPTHRPTSAHSTTSSTSLRVRSPMHAMSGQSEAIPTNRLRRPQSARPSTFGGRSIPNQQPLHDSGITATSTSLPSVKELLTKGRVAPLPDVSW